MAGFRMIIILKHLLLGDILYGFISLLQNVDLWLLGKIETMDH